MDAGTAHAARACIFLCRGTVAAATGGGSAAVYRAVAGAPPGAEVAIGGGAGADERVRLGFAEIAVSSMAYNRLMPSLRQMTAIIEREDDGFVSLCPELDIASQGATIEEARANLVEALTLFLETAAATEIALRLRSEVFVTQVEVPVGYTAGLFRVRSLHLS